MNKPQRTTLKCLKPRVTTLQPRLSTISAGSWRAGKEGSTARGYGYAWQRARLRYLAAHPFCVRCVAEGITIPVPLATELDHVIPHRGNQALFWDQSNWQPLCKPHHDDKTREEQRGLHDGPTE
jgi:5-methylcytosine-specific restriction endonuclease McrA